MVIRTIVAVAYLVVCAVAMGKVFWMLDLCTPSSQEPEAKAEARRWKGTVAAVVVGAWVCAAGIAFGLHLSEALRVVVFTGPAVVSLPVLVRVVLLH